VVLEPLQAHCPIHQMVKIETPAVVETGEDMGMGNRSRNRVHLFRGHQPSQAMRRHGDLANHLPCSYRILVMHRKAMQVPVQNLRRLRVACAISQLALGPRMEAAMRCSLALPALADSVLLCRTCRHMHWIAPCPSELNQRRPLAAGMAGDGV